MKLYKVVTKKEPFRAYIQGVSQHDPVKRLIVEVGRKQHPEYLKIVDQILEKLKSENISKQEAVALKQELCRQ